MKTIGEIIRSARLEKGLSVEEVSQATKIDSRHIEALEKNRFDLLPPATFTKGFIRNIAKFIGRPPDELIAVYRRDQKITPSNSFPSKVEGKATAVSGGRGVLSNLGLNRPSLLLLTAGVLIFATYLAFQYRAILIPPPLTISQPTDKAVLNSPITVTGQTSPDSLVTISPDIDVKPDSAGAFTVQVTLSPGDHQIQVQATNRFSRTSHKTINLTVLSSD